MLTVIVKYLSEGTGFLPSSLSSSPMNRKEQKNVRSSAVTYGIPPALGEEEL